MIYKALKRLDSKSIKVILMPDDTIVKSIFIASDFKSFLVDNITNIDIDDRLRANAMSYGDNAVLEVTKAIGSLKIIDVKAIDDDLVNDVLGLKG